MHPPDSSLVLFRLQLRHQAGLCGTTSLISQVLAQHSSLSKGPTAHKQALTGRFYSITTGKLKSSDSSQNTVGYKPATAIGVTIGQRFVSFFHRTASRAPTPRLSLFRCTQADPSFRWHLNSFQLTRSEHILTVSGCFAPRCGETTRQSSFQPADNNKNGAQLAVPPDVRY
ncbi:hypothetical protein GOODEAATRI_025142 [Goodea atripinnis]|uniref:Uncharacterized protein n=1 Tax=Goodea atripinnis TaxID=208336 RepID=A0ABV0MX04_9TELE